MQVPFDGADEPARAAWHRKADQLWWACVVNIGVSIINAGVVIFVS